MFSHLSRAGNTLWPLVSAPMGNAILIYLAAVNAFAFLAFGVDKWQAVHARRRVSERTLLLTALLLGAPGAWLGARIFHHKTSKRGFLWKLAGVTASNVLWIWAYLAFSR